MCSGGGFGRVVLRRGDPACGVVAAAVPTGPARSPRKSRRVSVVAGVSGLSAHSESNRDGGPGASELEDLVYLVLDLGLEGFTLGGESHEDDSCVDGCRGRCALRCHTSRILDEVGYVKRFCKVFLTKVSLCLELLPGRLAENCCHA